MTTKYDIVLPHTGTKKLVVNVIGGPTDLTGYTGRMQVREYKADTDVLVDVLASNIVVNPLTDQVVVTIPDELLAAYTVAQGVYDLYIIGPGGDRWRVIEGVVRFSQSVTRED